MHINFNANVSTVVILQKNQYTNSLIMGSYTDVKNLIISNIKTNGQREITGQILQDVLLNMLENSSRVEEITYSDLKALRDGSKLTPSRLYRITDYITTTVQSNTKSAGHPFDVIVLALSETELSEQAWAIRHDGDEYFANSNLSAWKIWYCLDNDTNRFAWADSSNGKGVIYRMIDEFNNDIPYDFKNIQFKHPNDSTTHPYYYYTFASSDDENNIDCSLDIANNCNSNIIKEYVKSGKRILNNIIFIGDYFSSNSFGSNCYDNSFGSYCNSNSFGSDCSSNSFGKGCRNNSFDSTFSRNTFGSYCSQNTFGSNCHDNSFGSDCSSNSFGKGCRNNSFDSDCYGNSFGPSCHDNSFSFDCHSNTFGYYCSSITFGSHCSSNTFGSYCSGNAFGSNCSYNSFGSSCSNIKFASDSSANTKYTFYQSNHFGDGCQYILFKGAETASSSAKVQNYNFSQGLQGTSDAYLTINGVRNRNFETRVERDSNGNLKEFCLADFIYDENDNSEPSQPSYPYSTNFIGDI